MDISISTCFDYSIPIEAQIAMVRRAGFSFVSPGLNLEHSGILDGSRRAALIKSLQSHGISVDSIHGYDMDRPDTVEVNKNIVGAATALGAPVIVLHCSSFMIDSSELEDRRFDLFRKMPEFEKMARGSGIKFAFENLLPGVATDLMEELLSRSNPDHFGFCYDSSHDQIGGPRTFELLERLSSRLAAVHISDRIKAFTDHVIPGEGFIDFKKLTSLLKRAGPKFPLLMEVMTTYSRYKNPEELLSAAREEAVKLSSVIDEAKAPD